MKKIWFFCFFTFIGSCTLLQAVDYATEIQPIFTANCNGCHIGGTSSGGLNLSVGSSYNNLVNVDNGNTPGMNFITPNDLSNSYLYLKITGAAGISGAQMPQNNQTYFDTSLVELQLIVDWINGGAVECEDDDACAEGYICEDGGCVPAADIDKQYNFPTKLILNPIYPNPFNPSATISWDQPGAENVQFSIFNLKGELTDVFSFTKSQPGFHSFDWHPAGLPAGVYLVRLTGETFTVTQKAIYLK